MNAIPDINCEHQPRRTLAAVARTLVCTLAVTIAAAISAHGYTTYSGASVGSNGTIYGWGVTDGTSNTMIHYAYVYTTLTRPVKHRQVGPAYASMQNWARADVSLPFDSGDLGIYQVQSNNQVWCGACMCYFINCNSWATITVPYVVLTLRTGSGLSASSDNAARGEYYTRVGSYRLDTFFSTGAEQHLWHTGVEIVGRVYPYSYTGTLAFKRQIVTRREYTNCVLDQNTAQSGVMDGYDGALQDQNPQSGTSVGWIYDLDAPAFGSAQNNPVGTIVRRRVNYREWAELPVGNPINPGIIIGYDLYWYSHLSLVKTSSGDVLESPGISGDNRAGVGSPPTSCNLQ